MSEDVVGYIDGLLKSGIDVPFYKAKRLLEINEIEVESIRLFQGSGLKLKSIKKLGDKKVDLEVYEKSWVEYLPKIYRDNADLVNFLYGFQLLVLNQKETIDNIDELFIPEVSKELDWLASWFGISFHSLIDDDAKRRFIYRIISLYGKRGTKEYLEELVEILTGVRVVIKERYIPKKVLENEYDMDDLDIKRSFTVKIDERLSQDVEMERVKFDVIRKIVLKEKPLFTNLFFEYRWLDGNEIKGDVITKNSGIKMQEYDYDEIVEFNKEDNVEEQKRVKSNDIDDDYDYDYDY